MDILFALLVLVGTGPFLLLIALAIRLESPGNPFYGGLRAGKEGKTFRMWKFRSMVNDAGAVGPRITANRDPRITRLGSLLRRSKLDELPQIFNLLLGDMTLVGPRPEDPDIVEQYTPTQRQVLSVKPGITGPGQLSHVEEESDSIPEGVDVDAYYIEHLLEPKINADLDYIRNRTFLGDVRIIQATFIHMIRATVAGLRKI